MFVNSRMATLLLAEAINKVFIKQLITDGWIFCDFFYHKITVQTYVCNTGSLVSFPDYFLWQKAVSFPDYFLWQKAVWE